MASSFFMLFDDIATLLDDTAAMTKVAAQKTAGVLGDDLALNAQQVSGVRAERELPVVWAVAKGSMLNKVILVPVALLLSWLLPVAMTPLLMCGGLFLCYEGFEKIAHLLHKNPEAQSHEDQLEQGLDNAEFDLMAFEKDKIKGAIRTDFILSAEIIVIALASVQDADIVQRITVLCSIAVLMTVGVYGAVASIVKLDDAGVYLLQSTQSLLRGLGRGLLWMAPWLMRVLSIAGTVAMFLVGGGILMHGIPAIHHWIVDSGLPLFVLDGILGILSGALIWMLMGLYQTVRGNDKKNRSAA